MKGTIFLLLATCALACAPATAKSPPGLSGIEKNASVELSVQHPSTFVIEVPAINYEVGFATNDDLITFEKDPNDVCYDILFAETPVKADAFIANDTGPPIFNKAISSTSYRRLCIHSFKRSDLFRRYPLRC